MVPMASIINSKPWQVKEEDRLTPDIFKSGAAECYKIMASYCTGGLMSFFERADCLKRLKAQVAAGRPVIGGGAGTGISAKCAAAGGIDLIILYNSGRFRMAGRGSLSGMMPYGDANQIAMGMARGVLPVVRPTPARASGCG